ncbi:MAG: hypothetical protein R3F21_09070 [Myxococcota bacterium]
MLRELSAERDRIAREKIPLSKEVATLEDEVGLDAGAPRACSRSRTRARSISAAPQAG